jgi:hypothetical protein
MCPAASGKLTDTTILAARATLGWREDPLGSNDAPFIRAWLADVDVHGPAPWCMAAVFAWFKAGAEALGIPNPCPRTAGSQTFLSLVPESMRFPEPAPGRVAVWRDAGNPARGHVGVVIDGTLGGFQTSRDGLERAKLARAHATDGTLGGFQTSRDGLERAKLALPHADEAQISSRPGWVRTIEGNTNQAGSRNGDHVAEHDWDWKAGRRGSLILVAFCQIAPELI